MANPRVSPPRKLRLLERLKWKLMKKDLSIALKTWVVFEVGSLFLVPSFNLLPEEHKMLTWLAITIPLGLMGSFLVGLSSEFIRVCEDHYRESMNKRSLVFLGLAGGWLGLAGVGFPLSILVVELWNNFNKLGPPGS